MNNFKELAKITKTYKENINKLYEILDSNKLDDYFTKLVNLTELKQDKSVILAILRRLVDLREDSLVKELEKNNFSKEKITQIKHLFYDEIRKFYENSHNQFIQEIKEKNILNEFYINLIEGFHKIGLVINSFFVVWNKQIIEQNNKILSSMFENLDDALEFLKKNKLYQVDRNGKICERSYGALLKIGNMWKFLPYAVIFENEVMRLEYEFDELINKLSKIAINEDEINYIDYIKKLKLAFCQKDEEKVISSWQDAELAWMKVKSPLQIGHPLEYYEDSYTHAVALEWDIRINDDYEFNEEFFVSNIKKSFLDIYAQLDEKDENLKQEVLNNIDKTQLYICLPMIYYGAELNGLFSAQVVPNDEYVSKIAGKKIFAFLNFVYENAKTKPFMEISNIIFDKEFLKYSRDILFLQERIWKQVYEFLTIGHEFGHIFFIDENSELKMNESGYFKNIEEFKATFGGLISFFNNEIEELKMPIFQDIIKRAISLIAYQEVDEVKPYYTEGLITLDLLFNSGVLRFNDKKLNIDFTNSSYESFKKIAISTYKDLAKHYILKNDAKDFLSRFCTIENGLFLPRMQECKEFVEYYYDLYKNIGNNMDLSGEFEKYKLLVKKS